MIANTDIDIDFADRKKVLDLFQHVPASIEPDKKHNTGVYFHEMPQDPITGLSTVDYKTAEDMGYFKIDCLNVSIYKGVRDEQHLNNLMEKQPLWELLEHKEFVDKVFHLSGHHKLLQQLKPSSIDQLAATLAIIRPAKRHLAGLPWTTIMEQVWIKPSDGEYYFKKAHAIAYAVSVVVHMNLLCE